MTDTPKTDAAAYAEFCSGAVTRLVVPVDFARAQERRIAELEERLRHRVAICNCAGAWKCGNCQDDEVALS